MTPDHDATRAAPPDHSVTRSQGDPSTVTGDAAAAIRELITDSAPTAGLTPATAPLLDAPPGFVIDREIGVGGMGVVYLAHQLGLNRPVALKLVKGSEKVDAKALIRFLAEAEAVAAVRHPHVVEVYQYGDHAGRPYLALEFCPGGDLTTLTKGEQSRDANWFRRVAELMAGVADGVNAAHALGIVHRDLKPHNVLLTADGTPKVADFGLAKRGLGSDLTNTDAVLGTPAYMAPEQAGGGTKFVGPEADVWALGVMLYELCCGQRPLDTSGPVLDALARVANPSIPALHAKALSVPTDLALIAHKCLSTDPRDRYPTAGGLAADLRNWLAGKPISARKAGVVEQAVKWAKRNKKLAAMGAAVLLTMGVATGVSLGFGLEADRQRKNADNAAEQVRLKADDLATALGEKTKAETDAKKKADDLATQLKESERLLDLSRLREAEADFERNSVQSARDKLAAIAPESRCIAWGLLRRRVEGSDLTLWGHTDGVTGVAFSPHGTQIVTGSRDGTARVWDAVTGKSLLELKGHKGEVSGVAFSPDGRRVVTGGDDQTARVWDAGTGQSLVELTGHTARLMSVAFSPDGTRVATASEDGTARVWDAASGQRLLELKLGIAVLSVGFSPDGRRVVTGSGGNTARVWDAETGKSLLELKGHTSGVMSVAFSPDGTRVATGSLDETARVWDAASGKSLLVLTGLTQGVTSVAFSPDGTRVATGNWDGTAQVWDAASGQSLLVLKGHSRFVTSLAISPDGRRVVTGGDDKTARVWDAASGQSVIELTGHTGGVTSVTFSPDGRRAVTGSEHGTARMWDAATGKSLLELKGHPGEVSGEMSGGVTSVAFSPNGRRVATGYWDGTARVWDAASGQSLLELKGHMGEASGGVKSVGFSPDGRRIVTGSYDLTARVWDAETGKSLLVLKGHTDPVTSVGFSPNGMRVVTGSEDGTARVWDAATGESLLELKGHADCVTSVGFSPDGRRIVTGSYDLTARVWDAATGRTLVELKGHSRFVTSVAFSPNGMRIVSGSWDQTARVWDAATGGSLLELKGHTGSVTGVGFSHDGRRIVTGSEDKTARVLKSDLAVDRPGDRPSDIDLTWRRWIARPQPDIHAKLAEESKADPFATGVQKSLEQRARGLLATEAGDFQQAFGHFLAAELLRPKSEPLRERLPPPRKGD